MAYKEKKALFIISDANRASLYPFLTQYLPNHLTFHAEILVIENDAKIEHFRLRPINQDSRINIPIKRLIIPYNQGYGGNQKIGFQYAIAQEFDAVAQIDCHDFDTFEVLTELFKTVFSGDADACFGVKRQSVHSLFNGYRSIKNYMLHRLLTLCQNWLLGLNLTDYLPEYRVYASTALKQIPFRYNSDDSLYNMEIIIQFALKGLVIKEIQITNQTNGKSNTLIQLEEAWYSVATAAASRMHTAGIFYKNQFDIQRDDIDYEAKFDYISSHTMALDAVSEGSKVLDLACGSGFLANALQNKKCQVTGIDMKPANVNNFTRFILLDLDLGELPENLGAYDYILALDCIEHLKNPEVFLNELRAKYFSSAMKIICTTANIAFVPVRLGLLLGAFNYGRFGILDFTHKRLFTFKSFKQLFLQEDYIILKIKGIPAPYPKALGHNLISFTLLKLNNLLIRIAPTLFSYQIYIEAKMKPPLKLFHV